MDGELHQKWGQVIDLQSTFFREPVLCLPQTSRIVIIVIFRLLIMLLNMPLALTVLYAASGSLGFYFILIISQHFTRFCNHAGKG